MYVMGIYYCTSKYCLYFVLYNQFAVYYITLMIAEANGGSVTRMSVTSRGASS